MCTDKTLVYLTRITYPSKQAHSIQITRTVIALAQKIPVILVVRKLVGTLAEVKRLIETEYGLEVPANLTIVAFHKFNFTLLGFPLLLMRLRAMVTTGDFVYYSRSYDLARHLLRYRWLHKRRVFFESHKMDGIHKEDPVPNSPYAHLRIAKERSNQEQSLIRYVYENVDVLFFIHPHSEKKARELVKVPLTQSVWRALKQERFPPFSERPSNYVYCGNVSQTRLFDLLIDAAEGLGDGFRVDVYGGSREDIEGRKRELARRNMAANFDFKGHVPNSDIRRYFKNYRFGIALLEGIKIVDYVENGLIPILPRLPSYQDIFDESNAVFFEPDSADSLRQVLRSCAGMEFDNSVMAGIAKKYSLSAFANKILRHL